MKTNELTGAALDWAVAKCEVGAEFICEIGDPHFYSTDWAQGGPIIEREKINLSAYELDDDGLENPGWQAWPNYGMSDWFLSGNTPLIAAMRCYVASKLGDEVEIPEELTQGESK